MKPSIIRRLNEINRAFYDSFAAQFSQSRTVLQPGIRRALGLMAPFGSLLDLGCGDARVGRLLVSRHQGAVRYVGVDASEKMLSIARRGASAADLTLLAADLVEDGWQERIPPQQGGFDAAVSFSVLHHLPSGELRLRFLREVRSLLAPGAKLALSVWQILHLPRFRKRIMPWSSAGIDESELEDGDLLLDWRRGGHGLRYVHHFDLEELSQLGRTAGLDVLQDYRSDGVTGDLGLYLILRSPGR